MSVFKGKSLRLEIFGASHAEKIGVTVTGLPTGEAVDIIELEAFMDRRAPGTSRFATARREPDKPVFLSGITDGVTDGKALRAVIYNTDVRRQDYSASRSVPRPGHADYTARIKYGKDFDMSGGGPFSGRMTAPLCIIGGICRQMLVRRGINIEARILSIGGSEHDFADTIDAARNDGDSVGGVIECTVTGFPAGYGGELFDGLEGLISELVFAIPAVKGIEFGAGFRSTVMRGSECNDSFTVSEGRILTDGNDHGGILGGISSGMPIVFRVAVKPTPSISKEQDSVDMDTLEPVKLNIHGRHDPCIVPRAVPVVEAAAAVALCDLIFAENDLTDLRGIRTELDKLDAELTELFTRRMELCEKVAEYKIKNRLPVLDSKREQEKLETITNLAPDRFKESCAGLYGEIFRLSREYQERMKEKQ